MLHHTSNPFPIKHHKQYIWIENSAYVQNFWQSSIKVWESTCFCSIKRPNISCSRSLTISLVIQSQYTAGSSLDTESPILPGDHQWGHWYFPCDTAHIVASLTLTELTHWGWGTHICLSKLTAIGSDNGLSTGWRPAIICTSAGI